MLDVDFGDWGTQGWVLCDVKRAAGAFHRFGNGAPWKYSEIPGNIPLERYDNVFVDQTRLVDPSDR